MARDARDLPLEELGGATIRADIAAMKHETQYTRLFRT
jgi:urease accessory protein